MTEASKGHRAIPARQSRAGRATRPLVLPRLSAIAACYAHMGRIEAAREIVERLRTITPLVVPNATYVRNPEHRELFLSGLRLAAGETA